MAYAGQTPGTDQTLADQPLEDRADMVDKTELCPDLALSF